MDAAQSRLMDEIYARQAAIYDLTRKYYLLGRDEMIEGLDVAPGMRVLEIACGTGRNLVHIGRRWPGADLYGLDISSEMLKQAGKTLSRAGMAGRIRLELADACAFDPLATFGVAEFDRIVFSYCVSMIPDWQGALTHALPMLAPGGRLSVVDFGQQDRLPGWFRGGLRAWLAKFHVTARADLDRVMADLASGPGLSGRTRSLYRDYARLAVLDRSTTV